MKIVILSGSPHTEGTTSRMVDSFIVGASEANHKIVRSDVALHDLHPCKG